MLLAACAADHPRGIEDAPQPPGAARAREGNALMILLDQSAARAAGGETEQAIVLAERALRLEPRNALVWYRLADLYLKQGDLPGAEAHARKAVQLARSDRSLQARAWRLIEQARLLSGNPAGAREAASSARELERK